MMKSMCLVVLLVFAIISIIPSESSISAKTYFYYLQVTTSCNSSVTTRDEISIVFGDHCGNQAGVLRIDTSSGTFDACKSDAFIVDDAPCLLDICYYNIYRSGSDGWKPEYFGLRGPYIYYIRFDVNEWIPADEWYGANSCSKYDPGQCSNPKLIQQRNKSEETCEYTVEIWTSCDSTESPKDEINLVFGDACGNEVSLMRIDDPEWRHFEACTYNPFDKRDGLCIFDICYLQLYRKGSDGWMPEKIQVQGDYIDDFTYTFNEWIPAEVWYGPDYCPYKEPSYCYGYAARSTKK